MYYKAVEYLDTRDLDQERLELKDEVIEIFEEIFEDKVNFIDYNYEDYASIIETKSVSNFDKQLLDWFNKEFETNLENVDLIKEFCDKTEDDIEEINEINALEEEIKAYSDEKFEYGVTLIPERHFEDYCEESCRDWGYISKDIPTLITSNINWAGVADDLKYDYTEVKFRGNTYLFR